ncbi:hypothetical protein PG995_002870 [Apiospora arundinis]
MTGGAKWDIPSGATAKVSIIDSTARMSGLPAATFFKTPFEGFDHLDTAPTWCLLVENEKSGRKVVFDLGVPKDLSTFAPVYVKMIDESGMREGFKAEKDVAQILQDNGVAPSEVSSIIWSHQHPDHIGDPNTFPKTTEIVVGQGFTKAYCPGYPANPESPVCEAYFADRTLREINYESDLKIGGLRAFDFFGDGSFYLLDTPGHTSGHLSALARTTHGSGDGEDDTFILMGGDVCHHGGELRPSPHRPLPPNVDEGPLYPVPASLRGFCPGSLLFGALQKSHGRHPTEQPFSDPGDLEEDHAASMATIREVQIPDAMDNVFFVFAHDATLMDVVEVFPAPANDWKAKGWAEKSHWTFLKNFAQAAAKFADAKN